MSLSRILLLLLVFCLLRVPGVQAAPDVRVVGLFKDRAVVIIEGRQRMLRVGQSSPEGVRLVAADSESALLEYQGEEFRGMLDGRVSTRSKPPATEEVQIWRNTQGMYATTGSINGLPVSLLVDGDHLHGLGSLVLPLLIDLLPTGLARRRGLPMSEVAHCVVVGRGRAPTFVRYCPIATESPRSREVP